MGWTDERVETLKKLWIEGLSASQIAKQLGGVTRNAVIGKVHRLGLAGRATPSRPAKRPRPVSRPRLASSSSSSAAARPRMAPAPYLALVPHLEPLKAEDGSVTTVLTLSDSVCKWPIGDPTDATFAFCGRSSTGTYCPDHASLAFQPQQPRKKRTYGEPDELRRMMRLSAM
ncbi:MAG: GcrA cell cycle regulator [Hyphomonadaceae bacterium]|nr:GcrA cell cycle regulator [Hyphomonadaceae bacterium]